LSKEWIPWAVTMTKNVLHYLPPIPTTSAAYIYIQKRRKKMELTNRKNLISCTCLIWYFWQFSASDWLDV
jgi:hypothetical protein